MAGKEERERRRAERLAAERAEADAAKRRLIAGYFVAGVLGLAVVAGLVVVLTGGGGDGGGEESDGDFPEAAHIQPLSGSTHDVKPDGREGTPPPALAQGDLEVAAQEAGCELDLNLPDEGNQHVSGKDLKYDTDPPTSGDHNPEQQADGAYAEMPDPVNFVHSLEHGRVEIQYSPDLVEDEQLALKGVFDESPEGMLFFPNPEMDATIATTAWINLMTCDEYAGAATLDAVRAFRDIYGGQGPENVPLVTG